MRRGSRSARPLLLALWRSLRLRHEAAARARRGRGCAPGHGAQRHDREQGGRGEEATQAIAPQRTRHPAQEQEGQHRAAGQEPVRQRREQHVEVGRQSKKTDGQDRHPLEKREREAQWTGARIDVERAPDHPVAEGCVDGPPEGHDRQVGEQRGESRAPRAALQNDSVGAEVGQGDHSGLGGQKRQGERDPGDKAPGALGCGAPAHVSEEGQHGEAAADERMPIRKPRRGHRVMLGEGEEQRRQAARPADAEESPIEKPCQSDEQPQPQHALHVHPERTLRP
jgi:hypothetical protein